MLRTAMLAVLVAFVTAPAAARDMKLTIYDDGISCPGGCDSHVVMNGTDNGTRFAFSPDSTRQNPDKCVNGSECRICFGEADDSCMTAVYRGGGPPAGTFDFTPAFYDEHCDTPGIPQALTTQCRALAGAIASLDYDVRINCFVEDEHAKCVSVLAAAKEAQAADGPKRERCLELGEAVYNAQVGANERRSNACNYSDLRLGGPNSAGVKWRILLPGACRPGTFVGRDGLDCCSGSARFVASVHPECSTFYPRP